MTSTAAVGETTCGVGDLEATLLSPNYHCPTPKTSDKHNLDPGLNSDCNAMSTATDIGMDYFESVESAVTFGSMMLN